MRGPRVSASAHRVNRGRCACHLVPALLPGDLPELRGPEHFQGGIRQIHSYFLGGGLDLAFRNGIFVDLTVSRFSSDGQRAFLFNGQSFGLGIPLTAREIPLELSGGYRFAAWRRLRPYAGGGIGSYSYQETSDFSVLGENVDVRHAGYLVVGGGEVRVNSWLAVAVDVQWTHAPGVLGTGGTSQTSGSGGGAETDLGGIAPRVRVLDRTLTGACTPESSADGRRLAVRS